MKLGKEFRTTVAVEPLLSSWYSITEYRVSYNTILDDGCGKHGAIMGIYS